MSRKSSLGDLGVESEMLTEWQQLTHFPHEVGTAWDYLNVLLVAKSAGVPKTEVRRFPGLPRPEIEEAMG